MIAAMLQPVDSEKSNFPEVFSIPSFEDGCTGFKAGALRRLSRVQVNLSLFDEYTDLIPSLILFIKTMYLLQFLRKIGNGAKRWTHLQLDFVV